MRRIARLTDSALVLVCLFFSGSIAAGESPAYAQPVKPVPPVVHGYCYADGRDSTVYFTAAFSSPPVGGPGGTTLQETTRITGNTIVAWRDAFERYLSEKHGSGGFIQCALEDSLPQAQTSRQALLDKFRRDNASYTRKRSFVETGWVYSAPTSPPGGNSPTPTAPAAQTGNAYCYSQTTTDGTVYYSPLLQTVASKQVLEDAFASYLARQYGYAPRYGYRGFLTCVTDLPADKVAFSRTVTLNNTRGLVTTVVETDWTAP